MDKLLSRASALVGLGPACTPTITFSDEAQRKKINVIKEGQAESLLVFTDKDPVAGEVTLKLDPGKRLEHLGVKIEFIGMIEMFYGNYHEFSNLVRDLDAPGELTATKTYPFDFSTVDKQVGRASRRARISGTHASAGLGGSVSARWCSLIAKACTAGWRSLCALRWRQRGPVYTQCACSPACTRFPTGRSAGGHLSVSRANARLRPVAKLTVRARILNGQYDSYNGINVKLRYLLRVTVTRQYRWPIHDESARGSEHALAREMCKHKNTHTAMGRGATRALM